MVAFGSGRGISVSANSAAGIKPSVFPPKSTTTPCSVYATTLTSSTSCEAAASCFSSNSYISLLISSKPTASSTSATASGSAPGASPTTSAEAGASGVPADALDTSTTDACAGFANTPFAESAYCVTSSLAGEAICSGELLSLVLNAVTTAAAIFDGFSWSESIIVGLQKILPI